MKLSRLNNFDLIRIGAALQVVYSHAKGHLKIENETIHFIYDNFLKYFPGVPIFFFVSGFLVYWSYDRNKDSLKRFYTNRTLRIFPALWYCTIITIILIVFSYTGNLAELFFSKDFLVWLFGQLTFFQFYTPDVLRFWGVGTPNGSLWTITVELQFYLAIPFIYYLINRKRNTSIIFFILALSVTVNYFIGAFLIESMVVKLSKVLLLPYLYYFMFGILAFQYWGKISQLFEDKFFYWLILYVLFILLVEYYLNISTTKYFINSIYSILSHLLLACLTLSFAFSYKRVGNKIVRGNDISYGVYIYHMLVINAFVQMNYTKNLKSFIGVFLITILISYISWIFVEKKALKLKVKIIN